VNRRRERRWQSSQDRARVAAELIEEAESLTETAAIASPRDVARDKLPPPLRVESKPAEAPRAQLDQESPAPPPPSEPPASPASAPTEPAPPVADDPLYVSAREASERGDLFDLVAGDASHLRRLADSHRRCGR